MRYNTKIVLNGQIDNDYKIGFTYPKPFDPARPSSEDKWLESLTDPRFARHFNSDKIFAYWKSEYGHYYSLIIPNALDSRDGKLMLTIFTGNYIVSSGKSVIDVLSKLGDGLIPNLGNLRNWLNNPDVQSSIDYLLSDLESYYFDDYYTSYNKTRSNIAYRTYSSQEELEEIIQFPNQEEYDNYKRILIVPQQSVPAQPPTGYEEIKSKIKKTFKLSGIIPDGVSIVDGKRTFVEGERIKLIYSKQGYVSKSVQFEINGTQNNYVRYEGTTLHLCSPEEIGIVFKRGLCLQFKSNKGIVSPVWIKYNGRQREHQSGQIFEFDDDRSMYELVISAHGYTDVNITISKEDILTSDLKTINLDPEEKKLFISLETDKGRKEGYVSVKVDDPLYPYLKKSQDSRIPINKKIGSSTTKNGSDNKSSSSILEILRSLWNIKIVRNTTMIVIGILSLYLLYSLFMIIEYDRAPWPFGENKKEIINESSWDPVDSDPLSSSAVNAEEIADEPNSEQEDIDYLKREDVWTKDNIKSEKYKRLYDVISEGSLDEIIGNEWFPKERVNGYWRTCFEILQNIHNNDNSDMISRVQSEMKRLSENESISVKELSNALKLIYNPSSVSENHNDKNVNKQVNSSGTSKTDDHSEGSGRRPSSR